MKKTIIFLLFAVAVVTGVWWYQSSRSPLDAASREAEERISMPPGWKHSVFGTAEIASITHDENGVTIGASSAGLHDTFHDFAWMYKESDKPLDAQARVVLDASAAPNAGAGWMIRAGLEPDAPFVSVYRDGQGRMMVNASAFEERPAIARAVKNTAGLEFLRIIVDGVVLKASCSSDGSTWPIAENISMPWLTNRVMIGCAVFSGDPLQVVRANFFGLHIIPR